MEKVTTRLREEAVSSSPASTFRRRLGGQRAGNGLQHACARRGVGVAKGEQGEAGHADEERFQALLRVADDQVNRQRREEEGPARDVDVAPVGIEQEPDAADRLDDDACPEDEPVMGGEEVGEHFGWPGQLVVRVREGLVTRAQEAAPKGLPGQGTGGKGINAQAQSI